MVTAELENPVVKERASRDYWHSSEMIYFCSGKGYGIVAIDGKDNYRELRTVCFGRESDILEYLKTGQRGPWFYELPVIVSLALVDIREKIQEEVNAGKGNDIKVESTNTHRIIRTGSKRARLASNPEHRKVDTRQLKAERGIPLHPVKPAKQGVFSFLSS